MIWATYSNSCIGLQSTRFFCPWISPDKISEVGSHSLLLGIFPTQGSNLGLPHCRQILYHLNHRKVYHYHKSYFHATHSGFPNGTSGKESACQCRRHIRVQSLSWENPPEEGMATHSHILAWRIPWTEGPHRLWSIGSQRARMTEAT